MNEATLAVVILVVCVIGAFVLIGLSFIGFLVPTVGIFGGLGLFIKKRGEQAEQMLMEAQTWPTTSGEITKSRVQVAGGEYTTVKHHIEYRFTVGAVEYTGNQVKAGDQFQDRYNTNESYDLVDKYPVGTQVTVYYDPADPARSALER
jgi:hypothetical protein